MITKLIKIGGSNWIIIPDAWITRYNLLKGAVIFIVEKGILITSKKLSRVGWREQFALAKATTEQPEEELLEGFADDFTEDEWKW